MRKSFSFMFGVGIMALVILPFSAAAVGIPIGGKVVSIIPCPHLAGYLYTVVGFGIGSGAFWYVPGTITYLYGPPVVGEWVLGLAAPVGACGPTSLMTGTSPI